MIEVEFNLEKAIQWAERSSNKYLNYHVIPSNEGYYIMSSNMFKRHSDIKTVYNTIDKVIDYKFTDINDSFSCKNRHIRRKVMYNHIHTSFKISHSFICIKKHIGGPEVGSISIPYYISESKWGYIFHNNGKETILSTSRMNRLSAYYKVYNKSDIFFNFDSEYITIEDKPIRLETRWSKLCSLKNI